MKAAAPLPHQQPFRFLDLPTELCLMVYERLVTRNHQKVELRHRTENFSAITRTVTLVTPKPVPPLHLACKLTYSEAYPCIQTQEYQNHHPRIIIDLGWEHKLVSILQLNFVAKVAISLAICRDLLAEDESLSKSSRAWHYIERVFESERDRAAFVDLWMQMLQSKLRYTCKCTFSLEVAIHCPLSSDKDMHLCVNQLEQCLEELSAGLTLDIVVTVYEALGVQRYNPVLKRPSTRLRYGGAIDQKTWDAEWM